MSRSRISDKLRTLRAEILRDGVPEFWVYGPGSVRCPAPSWEAANEAARSFAYRSKGVEYRAEERRALRGIVCLARSRSWTSYGVLDAFQAEVVA